jgi:hypothetical protein
VGLSFHLVARGRQHEEHQKGQKKAVDRKLAAKDTEMTELRVEELEERIAPSRVGLEPTNLEFPN